MEQPKFIINTAMSKEDYRKFLYIATFRRNKITIPLLALISLIGSIIVSLESGTLNMTKLIISWILLFALAIITVSVSYTHLNRKNGGKTAPPEGLYLEEIYY